MMHYDRRGGTVPHIHDQDLPPDLPEYPYVKGRKSPGWREWMANLTPNQQLGWGCVAVIVISVSLLYCVGAATFLVRPMLIERTAVTPTDVVRPTLVPTPTQLPQPSPFLQLPRGTLIATPTQAPIPPRESFVITPTWELGGTATPVSPPRPSPTPTRKPSPSVTSAGRP